MRKCKFCKDRVSKYWDDGVDTYFSEFDNSDSMAHSDLIDVRMGVDENGKYIIFAIGEETSNYYYPKYCPECGRKLICEKN